MPELEDGKYPPKIGARHNLEQQRFLKHVMEKRNMSQSQVILSGTPSLDYVFILRDTIRELYIQVDNFVCSIPRQAMSRDTLEDIGPREKNLSGLVAQKETTTHKEAKVG